MAADLQLLSAYEVFLTSWTRKNVHDWLYSKFYKAMLIKTKVVVEISLDKESDLAGFKEQI